VSPSTLDDGRIDGTRSTHGHALEAGAFRSDINGLRAWAVVAVALYHYGVPGFGGGFVGVDVFFVISACGGGSTSGTLARGTALSSL